MLGHGFMTGGEQKQVEATTRYFRAEVKNGDELALSWVPQYRCHKDIYLTDSQGGKEQATVGYRCDSTPFRLQSEVTKETLSHSLGLPSSAPQ